MSSAAGLPASAVDTSPPVFVELVREPKGKVQLYMRRKNAPSELDGGTCFYCLSHHVDADKEGSLFSKAMQTAKSLKSLAVTTDTFTHTGNFFCGFISVVRGVARATLPKVKPNSNYRVAVIFKLMGKSGAHVAEDPAPLLETTQLRELAVAIRKTPKFSAVLHVAGASPWTKVCIPSMHSIHLVAFQYMEWLARLTHRKNINLATPVVIRGVADPLCSQYIALAHKCGDVFRLAGGCRDEASSAKLFEVLALLGHTPVTKSAQNGPLLVDWFDFLLLSSLCSSVYPRLQQLVTQYRCDGWELLEVDGRLRTMVRPELSAVPRDSMYKAFCKQQERSPKLDSLASNLGGEVRKGAEDTFKQNKKKEPSSRGGSASQSIRSGSTSRATSAKPGRRTLGSAPGRAQQRHGQGRVKVASIVAATEKELQELTESEQTDNELFDPEMSLSAGRAIWSIFPLKQQLRVLRYVVPGGIDIGNELDRDTKRAKIRYLESLNIDAFLKRISLDLVRRHFERYCRFRERRQHQRQVIEARREQSVRRTQALLLSLQESNKQRQRVWFKNWKLYSFGRRVVLMQLKNLHCIYATFFEKWQNWSKPQFRIRIVPIDLPPKMPAKIMRVTTTTRSPLTPKPLAGGLRAVNLGPLLKSSVVWRAGHLGGTLPLVGSETATAPPLPKKKLQLPSLTTTTPEPSPTSGTTRKRKAPIAKGSTTPLLFASPKARANLNLRKLDAQGNIGQVSSAGTNEEAKVVRRFVLTETSQRQMTYTLLQVTELRKWSLSFQKWRTWLASLYATRKEHEANQRILFNFLSCMKTGVIRHYFRKWHQFITDPPPPPPPPVNDSSLSTSRRGSMPDPARRRSSGGRHRDFVAGASRGWNTTGESPSRRRRSKEPRSSVVSGLEDADFGPRSRSGSGVVRRSSNNSSSGNKYDDDDDAVLAHTYSGPSQPRHRRRASSISSAGSSKK